MPDEFETGFAYRDPMWHGKGVVLDHPATAAEAIIESGLDWNVSLENIAVNGIIVPDNYATVRNSDNTVLGIVGKRYVPYQNKDLFGFFDLVVEQDAAIYHTGGSLRNGRIVWLLAKLPASFYIMGNDQIDNYVLLASSHDGSMRITAKLTYVRVVCMNTLGMALLGSGKNYTIRHTASASQQMKLVHSLMGITTKRTEEFNRIANALLRKQIGTKELDGLINYIFPTKLDVNRHLERIVQLFVESPGILPGMAGTGWAAFNAMAEYLDYIQDYKEDRLYRNWFGNGESLRRKAIQYILKGA